MTLENNISLILKEKITVAVILYNDNNININQITISFSNKKSLLEEKNFIKVLKVTVFFIILFNTEIEGNTIWKQIIKIKQILMQLADF